MALSPSDSILRSPLLQHIRGGPLPAHSPQPRHEFVITWNEPSGRGSNATTILFRPRGFAPPRRFSPHRGVRACCVPVPDMGFAAFLDRQATSTEVLAAGGRATPFPKERGTARILAALTLRRFESRRQPRRIAAVVASTPFAPPPCRVGDGSDGPPADAASRPFPPSAAPAAGDVCRFHCRHDVEDVALRPIPQGSRRITRHQPAGRARPMCFHTDRAGRPRGLAPPTSP